MTYNISSEFEVIQSGVVDKWVVGDIVKRFIVLKCIGFSPKNHQILIWKSDYTDRSYISPACCKRCDYDMIYDLWCVLWCDVWCVLYLMMCFMMSFAFYDVFYDLWSFLYQSKAEKLWKIDENSFEIWSMFGISGMILSYTHHKSLYKKHHRSHHITWKHHKTHHKSS